MLARVAIAIAAVVATTPSMAEQLTPDAARQFIAGKLFAFNCFDGTRGVGRIYSDGSVFGSVQFRADQPVRTVALPAGTLHVRGQSYCASLRNMPVEPCFNVNRTDAASFRGSISGLGFAYCDFTRPNYRPNVAATTDWRGRAARPQAQRSAAAAEN
jgi:hypothetical protein